MSGVSYTDWCWKPRPEIEAELEALNKAYTDGEIESYSVYKSRWTRLKNQNTYTNRLKRYGGKVTCPNAWTYRFHGRHIEAEFMLDGCETEYWTVLCWNDVDPRVEDRFGDVYSVNAFDTKRECVIALWHLDMEIDKQKQEA